MERLSERLTADFLQAAILSLRRDVLPFVAHGSARAHADLITRVLYMLHARFTTRGADLQKLLATDRALVHEIAALVPDLPAPARASADDDHFSAIERLEQEVLQQELAVDAALPQLMKLACSSTPQGDAATAYLRKIVAAQQEFLASQDPDILKGSYVCYQGGRIEEERPAPRPDLYGAQITRDSLTRHLQTRFPGCRVEDVSIVAGGFSKTTVFFTLIHVTGEREALVMRKDTPVRFIANVDYEFPLLQKIYAAGFPVAEPRWLEDDPKPFGGRYMVSRRVKGSNDTSRWAGDPRAVDSFARQLARTMADLHALELERLGYLPRFAALSAAEAMLIEIDRWWQTLVEARAGREAYPLDAMAIAWLKANVPQTLHSRKACLVHGDIGFHNMMIDEGKVTALLDWEFSHVGDPVEDLVYTKPFIENVMDWDTFKGYYCEYGGPACTPEEEFFYVLWSKTRNPINGALGATLFAQAMPDSIKFASAGYVLSRYLSLEAGRMVVDAIDARR